MSVVDLTCDQSPLCPEASNSREPSPVREMYGPEKNESWQMSSAEILHTETVSPLPSSMDLLIQNSPDSSTSPSVILPTAVDSSTGKKEEKVQVKKQKIRTVFSQTQLCVLNERFQRQKYLSLQQMQELSKILNLSYKQIKTWFQNQRMKCKRWQKYNWPKNSNCATRKGSAAATGAAAAEYPSLPSCHQGCLVNASGSLSMWSHQPCNNPAWSNHSWNSQSWSYHAWNSQTWYPQAWNNQTWNNNQAWNNQFYSCGEEALQIQFPQNRPVSDWEAAWETAGESYDVLQQTSTKYCSTQQTMDFFPNYSMNIEPEDV